MVKNHSESYLHFSRLLLSMYVYVYIYSIIASLICLQLVWFQHNMVHVSMSKGSVPDDYLPEFEAHMP